MAWCRLADSHYPNRSAEQCLQTQSYVIIRLKLVNFTTSLLAQTVNGTGRPGTQRSTGHSVSVSGRPAAQRPTGHCVAGHPGTQRPTCPTGHCVAGHPGTQWWTDHCVAGHPGTQRSTAHCVAGTRVHSIVLYYICPPCGICSGYMIYVRHVTYVTIGSISVKPQIVNYIICKLLHEIFSVFSFVLICIQFFRLIDIYFILTCIFIC